MSGILCDYEIEIANTSGDIKISPFNVENVQPNSYDVTLDEDIYIIKDGEYIKQKLPYTIKQGEFVLGSTKEYIEINRRHCAELSGKSTVARHGVCIHLSAGFIDCGFKGNLTLELFNAGLDYELVSGMKIGQIVYHHCQTPRLLYGERNNHYLNQKNVTLPYDVPKKRQMFKRK